MVRNLQGKEQKKKKIQKREMKIWRKTNSKVKNYREEDELKMVKNGWKNQEKKKNQEIKIDY